MIDPDALDTEHPALARALGGGAAARDAVTDLIALLRRAGVEVPGYPADSAPIASGDAVADDDVVGPDTELSRSEFFQVITGTTPDRLED
jgi:hypothetical protein